MSPVADVEMRLIQTRIKGLLEGLASREGQILILRYYQGYSAAEVGQVLGLSLILQSIYAAKRASCPIILDYAAWQNIPF